MSALPQSIRVAAGLFVILVFLAAGVWFLWRCLKRSEDAVRLIVRWIVTVIVVSLAGYTTFKMAGDGSAIGQIAAVLAGAVFGLVLAILWVPPLVSGIGDAIGGLYTGGREAPTPTPAYSIAEARRKQGLHKEAVYEIQKQLNQFPTDVTGQMMLAEVQAESLHDLAAAEVTITRFLAQDHAPRNVAFALNSLADWRLKLNQDTDGAQRALEQIIALLPETEESQNAAQRIAHLATPEAMRQRQNAAPIVLPEGIRDIGLRLGTRVVSKAEENPEEAVVRLTAHLTEHPLDREARAKLAEIYVEHYQDLAGAIGQLEELVLIPNQTPRDTARWIHRIADFQVQQGQPFEIVQQTLQRIVDRYPGLAPAELAHQRLETLRLELKGKEKSQVVKLGSYEQNVGLRVQRPPSPNDL